jgi:hypothetical protein
LAKQAPLPSHSDAGVKRFVLGLQLGVEQAVPEGYFPHAPAPSHFPLVPQVDEFSWAHVP